MVCLAVRRLPFTKDVEGFAARLYYTLRPAATDYGELGVVYPTTTNHNHSPPSTTNIPLLGGARGGFAKKQTTCSLPSLAAEHQENCGAFVFLSPFFGYLFWRSKKLTKKQPHQIANTHPHAKFPSRVYTERSRSRGVSEGRGGCTQPQHHHTLSFRRNL